VDPINIIWTTLYLQNQAKLSINFILTAVAVFDDDDQQQKQGIPWEMISPRTKGNESSVYNTLLVNI
jgi:hypothetical protein